MVSGLRVNANCLYQKETPLVERCRNFPPEPESFDRRLAGISEDPGCELRQPEVYATNQLGSSLSCLSASDVPYYTVLFLAHREHKVLGGKPPTAYMRSSFAIASWVLSAVFFIY